MQPDLISKMQERYQTCESYDDCGSIRITSEYENEVDRHIETSFTTRFRRPATLSYDWTDSAKGKFRVWVENGIACISTPRSGISQAQFLKSALKETSGISHGGTMLVPAFLSPPSESFENIFRLNNIKILEPESTLGRMCYTLTGTFEEPEDTQIWISDDYLLRKLRRRNIMSVERQQNLLSRAKNVAPSMPEFSPVRSYAVVREYTYLEITIL